MPEGIIHGKTFSFGSFGQGSIASYINDSLLWGLPVQGILQLKTARQVNRVKATQGVFLTQVSGLVDKSSMSGKKALPGSVT